VGKLRIGVLLVSIALIAACQRQSRRFETCTVCGSTRMVSSLGPRILYRSPSFTHGVHVWHEGISAAARVSTGAVVLVRKQPAGADRPIYGAFVLTGQRTTPEAVGYDWFLLPDGASRFDPQSDQTGHAEDQNRIAFGPFRIAWSSAGEDAGYVYYDHYAHESATPSDTYMCLTSEKAPAGLDAADSKWVYKFSPIH
jgi:hypothetical protein